MKINKLLYTLGLGVLLASCATTPYYQLYNVKPVAESLTNKEDLFYEDDNCKITYDFWANGGDIGFNFYNKTDQDIEVALDKSYFVMNGYAHRYFKNRTFTNSSSASTGSENSVSSSVAVTGVNIYNYLQSNGNSSSSKSIFSATEGNSVSIKEENTVVIPSKTMLRIAEFGINDVVIRNCTLYQYPTKRKLKKSIYKEESSPLVFSNRISYSHKGKTKLVENKFFVSEISNYPTTQFFDKTTEEFCGVKSMNPVNEFRHASKNSFYLEYKKGKSQFKH